MTLSKHLVLYFFLLLFPSFISAQCVVLMYPFDGNANDTSSNNLDATVHGATLSTDRFGAPNSAYEFDGIDDYLDAGNAINLNQQSAITISAWFNVSITDSNNIRHTGISIGTKSTGEMALRTGHPAEDKFQAVLAQGTSSGANGAVNSAKSDSLYSFGTWYHAVGVYQDNKVTLWINGIEQSDSTQNNGGTVLSTVPSSASLWIGKSLNPNKTKFFKGKIDDVVILSCAADSSTVQTLYQTPPGQICADTAVSNFSYQQNLSVYNFFSKAKHTSKYLWDFGDGNTSSAQNPTHSYQKSGNYTVCLIASNLCFTDTICQNITVCTKSAHADYRSQFTSGLQVQFYQSCTNAKTFLWDFDDGNYSFDPDPLYAFSNDTVYNVCLTATDSCGKIDTYCKLINLHDSGLDNTDYLKQIKIFPTPTNDLLFVELPKGLKSGAIISVFDLQGKVLSEGKFATNKPASLDLSQYPNGIYLLNIQVDQASQQLKIHKTSAK